MEKRNKMNGKNSTIFIFVLIIACIALGFNYLKLKRNLDDTFNENINLGQSMKARDLKISSYEQELQFGKDMLKETEQEKNKLKSKINELENNLSGAKENINNKVNDINNLKGENIKLKSDLEDNQEKLKTSEDEKADLSSKIEQLAKEKSDLINRNKELDDKIMEQKKESKDISNDQIPAKNLESIDANHAVKEIKDSHAQNQGQAPPAADINGGGGVVAKTKDDIMIGNDEEDVNQVEQPLANPQQ